MTRKYESLVESLKLVYFEKTQKELPIYGIQERLLHSWVATSKDMPAGTVKVPHFS